MFLGKRQLFRKHESYADPGTACWNIVRLKTTNAKKGPHKEFNAYKEYSDKEYSDKETDAQILAATMVYFDMKSFSGDHKYVFFFLRKSKLAAG